MLLFGPAQQVVLPPSTALSFIPRRIGSSSFDAALKSKPQSRREASLRKSAAAAKKAENEAAASKKVEEEAASASAKKVEEESNEQSNKQEVVEVQDFNDLALMEPSLGRFFFCEKMGVRFTHPKFLLKFQVGTPKIEMFESKYFPRYIIFSIINFLGW